MPMPTIIIVNKIRVRSNTSDGALWTINISMKMFHYRVLVTSHVMLAPVSEWQWSFISMSWHDTRDTCHPSRVTSLFSSYRIVSLSVKISHFKTQGTVWYLCIWKAMCYPEKQSSDVRLACPGSVLWHLWRSGKTEHDPSRAGDNA